jgi:phosphopantothenoylcysteine decarboxylase/phosphopantothenate--cysteine ligase
MSRVRRLILGISGGIAAYKAPLLIRKLVKEGVEVKAAVTRAALPLVGPETLRTLTGYPVYADDGPAAYDMDHIRLAEWADTFIICPATANCIAKLAHGIADNLLTTLALSFEGPVLAAPAMNTSMWRKPVTRDNIARLFALGVHVLPAGYGELACGTAGEGRLLSIEAIAERVLLAHMPRLLDGKNVLIASGPTAEPLDAVRVLTNRSSGAMGAALASAALAMGARVSVVAGPAAIAPPEGTEVERIETAEQMRVAMLRRFDDCDVCVMAAAVADFRPERPAKDKLSREREEKLSLSLVANDDIAAGLGARKTKQFLVGFSLETDDNIERARAKMMRKRCDMMIFNRVDQALGGVSAAATILCPDAEPERLDQQHKRDAAAAIMLRIAQCTGSRGS